MAQHMRRSVALLAAGVVLALAGCSASTPTSSTAPSTDPPNGGSVSPQWAAVEAAANQEGEVTWYSSQQDSLNTKVVEAFNQVYPEIRVSVTRLVSGDLSNRFSSEYTAGAAAADVIQISDNILLTTHPEWFESLNDTILPNLANVPTAVAEKVIQEDYVTLYASPFTITINTDLVKNAPTTWEDLLTNPELKGNGGIVDPRAAASYSGVYSALRVEYGDSFLVDLGKSRDTFWTTDATESALVAAGSSSFLAPTVASNTKQLRDQGAPLDPITVTPQIALVGNGAINSKSVNPNAARVFLNFILSRDGRAAVCSDEVQNLMYSDIPNCTMADPDLRIVDYAKGIAEQAENAKLLGLE